MPRPRTPIGVAGEIRYRRRGDGYAARTQVRDHDGVAREVQRTGKTKTAAKNALLEAIRDRRRVSAVAGDLQPTDSVAAGGDAWWTEFLRSKPPAQTQEAYEAKLKLIKKGLAQLQIQELTVGRASIFLAKVEEERGAAVAKMTRTVLSNICGFLARRDLMDRNVVSDTAPIRQTKKKPPVALPPAEIVILRKRLAADKKAVARDLPEFVAMMLATGVRIGECAAFRPVDLDLSAKTINLSGNIVRVKGVGLRRQEEVDENNKLKIRTLELPDWACAMLADRLDRMVESGTFQMDGPLFPAPLGGWRDRSNTARDLRDALDVAGYGHVTSHVFRKSVATAMDDAGIPTRKVSDQLGHSKTSMTQDSYLGRGVVKTGAAEVLAAFDGSD